MKSKQKKTFFLIIYLLISIIIFFAIKSFVNKTQEPPEMYVATLVSTPKSLNDFVLTDTDGNELTAESLKNQWTLLFFGYTRCPDTCPATLAIVRDSWSSIAASNNTTPVRFVFADISNDPVNQHELKDFLHNYNAEFIGVTGSPEAMHALSDQLGIFAQKQDDKIDHTASLLLIDPQGRLTAVITPPFTAQQLAHDLQILTL
jgi:protein SCO1/2